MIEWFRQLPPEMVVWMREGGFVVVTLLATWLALRMVGRWVEWLAVRLQAPPLALRPLATGGRLLVSLLVASVLVGHFFNVDFFAALGGLLALIGIGFVAVWSTLSNVLCTLLLLTVKPFRIGDEVELPPDPLKGRVVDLDLFFTTLEAADGRLLQIPNNLFFQRPVIRRLGARSIALGEHFTRRRSTESNGGTPPSA